MFTYESLRYQNLFYIKTSYQNQKKQNHSTIKFEIQMLFFVNFKIIKLRDLFLGVGKNMFSAFSAIDMTSLQTYAFDNRITKLFVYYYTLDSHINKSSFRSNFCH